MFSNSKKRLLVSKARIRNLRARIAGGCHYVGSTLLLPFPLRHLTRGNVCRIVSELRSHKSNALENKSRLDASLRDVRWLNKKVGALEQQLQAQGTIAAMSTLRPDKIESHRTEDGRKQGSAEEVASEVEKLQGALNAAREEARLLRFKVCLLWWISY
jgi:hypothetical protein